MWHPVALWSNPSPSSDSVKHLYIVVDTVQGDLVSLRETVDP